MGIPSRRGAVRRISALCVVLAVVLPLYWERPVVLTVGFLPANFGAHRQLASFTCGACPGKFRLRASKKAKHTHKCRSLLLAVCPASSICMVAAAHEAEVPLTNLFGEWYGGVAFYGEVQLQSLNAGADGRGLAATKLTGREDIGPGEVTWQVQGLSTDTIGIGRTVAAEVHGVSKDGQKAFISAEFNAASLDELTIQGDNRTATFYRIGALGLERVACRTHELSLTTALNRVLFDYSSPGGPSLLPIPLPIVNASHLWRARGAVFMAVIPEVRAEQGKKELFVELLPPPTALDLLKSVHAIASDSKSSPPRLALIWEGSPDNPGVVQALADVKDTLGPRAELYWDGADVEGSGFVSLLSNEADIDGPGLLLVVVAPNGLWNGIRVGQNPLSTSQKSTFSQAASDLLAR